MKTKPFDKPFCGVSEIKIRRATPAVNPIRFQLFHYYITERYNIHLEKDVMKNPWPWTEDLLLTRYKFTNVRREHDTHTRWVIDNIVNNPAVRYKDKLLNIILFRLYNKYETAKVIGIPIDFSSGWDPKKILPKLKREAKKQCTVFTDAFYASGLKRVAAEYVPKKEDSTFVPGRILWLMDYIVKEEIVDDIITAKTQRGVYRALTKVSGIGGFMAYQMFVDMTYIKEFPFSENEFVVSGIGCSRGLDFLFDDKDGMSDEECVFWLRDNYVNLVHTYCDCTWYPEDEFWDLDKDEEYINVMMMENCLCEYSKYMKAKLGRGRPRKLYVVKGRVK